MKNNEPRRTGKRNSMILGMIPTLNKGGKCAVIGCKDPQEIANILRSNGIEVKSEPTFIEPNSTPLYSEEGIIGFKNTEKIQTGYIFYKL